MRSEPLDADVLGALRAELDDPAALVRLVRLYLDRLGDRCEEVVNAADADDLAAAAHSLASASATFGAPEVARIAAELEQLGRDGQDAPAPLLDELLTEGERARVALEQLVAAEEAA